MYIGLYVNYLLFVSDFNKNFKFHDRCLKNIQIPNLMKICPAGAELLHADGWTDLAKRIVAFLNFANVRKTR